VILFAHICTFSCVFCPIFTTLHEKELQWENWHGLLETNIWIHGDIWEVTAQRQLSHLSSWSLFPYRFFTIFVLEQKVRHFLSMFTEFTEVDKCSLTKFAFRGFSWHSKCIMCNWKSSKQFRHSRQIVMRKSWK
jgi:hypothetical protein